jgi:hypothetical protein
MFQFRYNISQNGRHIFRTDWYGELDAKRIAFHLLAVFTAEKGYQVTEARRNTEITDVDLN